MHISINHQPAECVAALAEPCRTAEGHSQSAATQRHLTHGAWDSVAWRVQRDRLLLEWMAGDVHAVRFLVDLSSLVETWDDLIDRDRAVGDSEIHGAFTTALIGFNLNPFYRTHQDRLLPLLITCINAWMDSVPMQRGDDAHERMWAFFLKDLGRELFIFCAFLAGGFDHMRSVSMAMRRFFTHETYDVWEHRHGIHCAHQV